MNRARRSVTVKKKPVAKQPSSDDDDDDFESEDGADFSASEEEWLPGKDKGKKGADSEGEESAELDEDEEEEDDDDEDPSGDGSGSDESVVATKKAKVKRSSKGGSPKQPAAKKKRLSPKTRDELYSQTKKFLLKERDPDRPPLNSSVSDILKNCQFQPKKNFSSQSQRSVKSSKPAAKGDDSESSGDEHLINPDKLDLNSEFFDRVEKVEGKVASTAVPQFDCNAGMRLSDSSEDEEDRIPASIPKVAADQLISKINESSSGFMNFGNLGEFNRKIQEAKEMLKNYQSKGSQQEGKAGEDVSNLLALGEAEAGASPGKSAGKASQQDESEESDWEEVEEGKKSQALEEKKVDGEYAITVEVEETKSKKKRWEEIEMELYIKRQINKVKREKQLAYHKSSVLCCIAEGRKLNEIVGSGRIQAMMLSCMQAKQCVLKGKTDVKFVEQLMGWFKSTFQLNGQQMLGEKQPGSLKFSLALELFTRKVSCKRNYILLFLACLRAVGVHCRLVISANAPPKRPAMKDLCPISERQLIEQFEREFKGKGRDDSKEDTTVEVKVESLKEEVKEEIKEEPVEEQPKATPSSAKKPTPSPLVPKVLIEKIDLPSTRSHSRSSQTSKTDEPASDTKPTRSSRVPKVVIEKQPSTRSRSRSSQAAKSDEQSRKLRFSPEPELLGAEPKSATPSPSAKENPKTRKSILKTRASPRIAASSRKALNTLNIPQLDGLNDIATKSPRRRSLRGKATATSSESPFAKRNTNTPQATVKEGPAQPGRVSKRKLFTKSEQQQPPQEAEPPKKAKPAKNKILSSDSEPEPEPPKTQSSPALSKKRKSTNRKAIDPDSDDSDFELPGDKTKKAKQKRARSETPEVKKSKKKAPAKKGKKAAAADKDADTSNTATATNKTDMWIEFYGEKEKLWKTLDLFGGKVDCAEYLANSNSNYSNVQP